MNDETTELPTPSGQVMTADDIYDQLAIILKCTRQDAEVAMWTWACDLAGIRDVAQPEVKIAADADVHAYSKYIDHLRSKLDGERQTIHRLRRQVVTLVELLQEFTHYTVTYND